MSSIRRLCRASDAVLRSLMAHSVISLPCSKRSLSGRKRTWLDRVENVTSDPKRSLCARLRSGVSGEARGEARGTGNFRRKESVLRPCQLVRGTPLLARQQCARLFSGNYPIRVDSRFCRAHPYTDKSQRRHSHSTLEGRTELGRPFERRSPRSASNTS